MNEFANKISDYSYVAFRSQHLSELLQMARMGRLDPDWRSNMQSKTAQFNATGLHADAETTAISELQMLAPMPWEPNQSTWRHSLDSWYAVSIKTHTLDYVNTVQLDLNGLSAGDLAGVFAFTGVLAEKIFDDLLPHYELGDNTRRNRERTYVGVRMSLTGSYLAGLAAGGMDIDWRGWYRGQIAKLPDDHPMIGRLQSEISSGFYEQIPQYWRNP